MRAYKPDTMELPENEGGRGHYSDSWSYPVFWIWPIKFNIGGGMQSVITGNTPTLPQSSGPVSMGGVW